MTSVLLVLPVLLAATPQQSPGRCDYESQTNATLSAEGVRSLSVLARAGSLTVTGGDGAREIRVRGRACASSADLLREIDFEARRSGDVADVRVSTPNRLRNREYARLDLVIEVPAGMAADIDDSSGDMELTDLGALRIDDSSGSITVLRAAGNVRVQDNSGDILVRDVRGGVWIDDNSGTIEVEQVEGDLEIEDGSGEILVFRVQGEARIRDNSGGIEVQDIGKSVIVLDDGSGDIRVRGVQGDFRVDDDGGGSIRYSDVAGTVTIPRNKRR